MITWDVKAAEQKAGIGMWGGKNVRLDVYKQNAEIFREGCYQTDSGKVVQITVEDPMLAKTRVYSKPFNVNDKRVITEKTTTAVINTDCMILAREMLAEGLNPAVLNLADAYHACGFYHRGSRAQEESICRVSTLSRSLYQLFEKKFADIVNVPFIGGGYPMDMRNGGIYSPDVTVFRDGNDWFRLIDEPYKLGIISLAALDFNEKHGKNLDLQAADGGFTPEGFTIMQEKIRTIYRIALDNGHDSLVLGAFGCGAFRLPADVVAKIFYDVLQDPEFKNKFKAVRFAILEKEGRTPIGPRGKFAPFYQLFS